MAIWRARSAHWPTGEPSLAGIGLTAKPNLICYPPPRTPEMLLGYLACLLRWPLVFLAVDLYEFSDETVLRM